MPPRPLARGSISILVAMRLSFLLILLPGFLAAQSPTDPIRQREREIFRELIEVNTSDSAGHTPELTEIIARRLEAAGFPSADIRRLGYAPRYQSMVVRYRGRST